MTSGRLAILHAILAAAQVVSAGAALADVVGSKPAALAALVVAGIQAGLAAYTGRIATTPADRVPLYARR
jgi:hypothetical protein